MSNLYGIPKISSKLVDDAGNCAKDWFLFFASLVNPQPEQTITVGTSPFTYKATQGGMALITGGTVSLIQLIRSHTYTTGLTSGFIPMSTGDQITITHTGAPTMVFFPR